MRKERRFPFAERSEASGKIQELLWNMALLKGIKYARLRSQGKIRTFYFPGVLE